MQIILGATQKESGSLLKESGSFLLRSWPYKCLLATYTISWWVGRGYQSDDAENLPLGYRLSISEVLASHLPWQPPEGRREKDSYWGGKAHTLEFNWAGWSCLLFYNSVFPSVIRRNITVKLELHLHHFNFFSVQVPLNISWGHEDKDIVDVICAYFAVCRI